MYEKQAGMSSLPQLQITHTTAHLVELMQTQPAIYLDQQFLIQQNNENIFR